MGYAQGMNNLLARFLVVTDSEVDSVWMFAHYMANKRLDFMESSMMRKVGECKHTHIHFLVYILISVTGIVHCCSPIALAIQTPGV